VSANYQILLEVEEAMFLQTVFMILLRIVALQPDHTTCVVHAGSLEYPQLARMARLEGEISVNVAIASDGRVDAAVATSGHPLLMREAQENMREWRFTPGEKRKLQVTYHFKLKKPETAYRPPTTVAFDFPVES